MVTQQSNQRKLGLDIPRTAAILAVLVCHYIHQFHEMGFYGVELFFALSGYLIGGILFDSIERSNDWTLKHQINFWARRWWRTLPNYYLFLGVWFLVLLHLNKTLPEFDHLVSYFIFTQEFLKPSDGFYALSWSLCIEEWFYIAFPLCVFILVKSSLSAKKAFLVSTVILLTVSIYNRHNLLYLYTPEEVRMITIGRLDSILYGVLIVYIVKALPNILKYANLMAVVGVSLFIITLQIHSSESYWLIRLKFITAPLGFAMILPQLSKINSLPKRVWPLTMVISYTSLWSYSLYLSHMPILYLCNEYLGWMKYSTSTHICLKLIAVTISFILSAFIYSYFEVPLTKKRPKAL